MSEDTKEKNMTIAIAKDKFKIFIVGWKFKPVAILTFSKCGRMKTFMGWWRITKLFRETNSVQGNKISLWEETRTDGKK